VKKTIKVGIFLLWRKKSSTVGSELLRAISANTRGAKVNPKIIIKTAVVISIVLLYQVNKLSGIKGPK
jgi:hypothetical protein